MKRSKYSKIKRNFLVRLIRWAYKCLDSLFKRKKSTFRSSNRPRSSHDKIERFDRSEARSEARLETRSEARLEARLEAPSKAHRNEQLITVGELFGRVKWQSPEEDTQSQIFNVIKSSKPQDVSLN
jgi:hypothetical protein